MRTEVSLPSWLDSLIFNELGANYCRSNADMTVIDWDKTQILNYLGTYFPRSFAESMCIYSEFIPSSCSSFLEKEHLDVLDFGCGTGGEIIGLLLVLNSRLPNLKSVTVKAIDGNIHAIKLLRKVIDALSSRLRYSIELEESPITIDDFYDMSILDVILSKQYDIVMSFKAVCEFVTKQQFEDHNAYEQISRVLLPKLAHTGIMLLVDVSTYSNVSQDWLPNMMDRGLLANGCRIIAKNPGNNMSFYVSHSRHTRDLTKIAWRLIQGQTNC